MIDDYCGIGRLKSYIKKLAGVTRNICVPTAVAVGKIVRDILYFAAK